MKFMSILLVEGRKEDLRAKYIKVMDPEVLDWILGISDLQDFNHKYTDFVLRTLNKESEDLDMDVEVAIQLIKDFDKYQSQLDKKDINQYKSIIELENSLKPVIKKQIEKEEENKVKKIYEDDKFVVVKPETHAASCKYGSNTKWCTTSGDPQHFNRYTTGSQVLYYVINKANSTNKNYSKVAVHFDGVGNARYWNSQDVQMNDKEVEIFNYAFPELVESMKEDYKKFSSLSDQEYLQKIFNSEGNTTKTTIQYLGQATLNVRVVGFETIDDLGLGHAIGSVTIILNNTVIDSYETFIFFRPIEPKSFKVEVGFSGNDPVDEKQFIDLGLESWDISGNFSLRNTDPSIMSESVRNLIASKVSDRIKDNPKLLEKVLGTSKVFTPTYGYTFRKNKGWVKKLVDYLDSGKVGTKLDFLVDMGYLIKTTDNGKTMFRKYKGNHLYTPRELRGQHASFFAAAKNSGILDYRKEGKDFFLIKGPNFDAFKSGELKAL